MKGRVGGSVRKGRRRFGDDDGDSGIPTGRHENRGCHMGIEFT